MKMNTVDNIHRLLYLSILLLIVSCVFDPSDKILRMKLPLFGLCWLLMLIEIFITGKEIVFPIGMLIYLCLILSLPFLSIIYYTLFISKIPYNGLQYLKSYILITLLLVLYLSKIDIIKPLCIALTALSCFIIYLFIYSYDNPLVIAYLHQLGQDYSCFRPFRAQYGPLVYFRMFYVTAPMIAISIAYFVFMSVTATKYRKWFILLSFINIIAMFLAGSRATIVIAIVLPILIILLQSKHKQILLVAIIMVGFLGSFLVSDIVEAMFNPSERSNVIKITHIQDYKDIFAKPDNLLLGQGIGSYHFWTGYGEATSVTELTFLEIFRNYGLIFGTVLLILIFYPLFKIKMKSADVDTSILIGYATYLVISSSNPLLFSSSGMLILSAIVGRLFLNEKIKTEKVILINKDGNW